jgi:maltose phosphorylase
MNKYLKEHEWEIVEEGFAQENQRASESIFSLGNGHIGQRANFEERYTGDSLQGNYIAGIYYPDKTKVGWWKNGYPEYFAKVLNAPNWVGIHILLNNQPLDLATAKVKDFRRVLNMKEGFLERTFTAEVPGGQEVEVHARRFLSVVNKELGAIEYTLRSKTANGRVELIPFVDADVINEDANYNEKFWEEVAKEDEQGEGYVVARTKKLDFVVATGMKYQVLKNGNAIELSAGFEHKTKYVSQRVATDWEKGDEITMIKFGAVTTSENHAHKDLIPAAKKVLKYGAKKGFNSLFNEQKEAWAAKWKDSDVIIEGDAAAQQAIRFNIFHLNQTYTGEDERLNIGPKGFTGEKYGGSTYWDTEAYCLPFYLRTAPSKVAKNLLLYRYKHLPKAIENAEKLGFSNGAALYPMVTMNGEECHNEWEITFEEIHRNGAIAYAIYNYTNYTGDKDYLIDYGLEVLVAISRFWAQRVNFSQEKQQYVMLGVTGPNEYENNVNNNWYTSTIALWTLRYTQEAISYVKQNQPEAYNKLINKIGFSEEEIVNWQDIDKKMFLPEDPQKGIFLQQEGYLDKHQMLADELPQKERPINQHWSWDRILRSCFIKQADVLQGLYFLEEQFDEDTIRRNFDFYEPRTVHESSLSPCVHSILAGKLGYEEKAYELYLRTARLDLDDYNNEVGQGLHITSMAGTWMSIVEGFAGMRIRNNQLHLAPFLPKQWERYSFNIRFREHHLKVEVDQTGVKLENQAEKPLTLEVFNTTYTIEANGQLSCSNQ